MSPPPLAARLFVIAFAWLTTSTSPDAQSKNEVTDAGTTQRVDQAGRGPNAPGKRNQRKTSSSPKTKRNVSGIVLLDRVKSRVRVEFQLELTEANQAPRPVIFDLSPSDRAKLSAPGLARLEILRPRDPKKGGKVLDGRLLRIVERQYSQSRHRWEAAGTRSLQFWPVNDRDVQFLTKSGHQPQSWHGRPLRFRVELLDTTVRFYFEGRLVSVWPRTDATTGTSLVLHLDAADKLQGLSTRPLGPATRYETGELDELAQAKPARRVQTSKQAPPFALVDAGNRVLDLSQAGWIDEARDPADYFAAYDSGPYTLNDVHMPMLTLPKADYVAAYVLASAVKRPDRTSTLTLRVGRYGGRDQVVKRDYSATIPARGAESYDVVRIPLTETVAQDVIGEVLDVELTKEVRLARHVPDPNHFDRRPLGIASGVRVAAITFEKSPLQMQVGTRESGNAFVEPERPVFDVRLENITGQTERYSLQGLATHLRGRQSLVRASGEVPAHSLREVHLQMGSLERGYHDFVLELKGATGDVLLRRQTSFAVLPRDSRKHRDTSPFGTWEWGGKHVTSTDSDFVGSLYEKLGFRFGMSKHPIEARKKWRTEYGFEAKLDATLNNYERTRARDPDLGGVALLFHEDTLSARHAMRIPDLFTDHTPFSFGDDERAKYERMLKEALQASSLLRRKYPDVKISFGNGPPATKEAFYRRGFPANAFDYAGNEAGCFHRLPETQPPDFVALNASLWMDRQLLDAYGYKNKGIHQSYETCFPADNPGNLSSAAQADYFARHALHSLAWGMDFINMGMLMDTGNSYYYSNWGASGLVRAIPEANVKPAFVAMATLTRALDGAKFVARHDTGSPSLYALEFARADGQRVLAYWTVRGERKLRVQHDGGAWTLLDDQGRESKEAAWLTASTSPNYLLGRGSVGKVTLGAASYAERPPNGAIVVGSFGDWHELSGRSSELEEYDFMTPRRRGDFAFDVVKSFEGRGPSLQVVPRRAPGKDAMPMYERLAPDKPLDLPGRPNEIGVWIDGNSGWGRVVFELTDSSGQRWTSLGAQTELDGKPVSDWNTDDPYGLSAINFDGWRYVAFPLPGNYPGESHPWPGNSNWRYNRDGVVHYPLRLVGVAITLPSKVLQVKTWAAAPRQAIYLEDIVVGSSPAWLQ